MDQSYWARPWKYGAGAEKYGRDEDQFSGYDESTNSSDPLRWQESGRLWVINYDQKLSQSLFNVVILYDMRLILWAIWYGQYRMFNIVEKVWSLERFEISVCGVPFTIHLKDVDYTKNGKRWSQVMYMNYLVKYKINVLKEKKISAYRKGNKKGKTV